LRNVPIKADAPIAFPSLFSSAARIFKEVFFVTVCDSFLVLDFFRHNVAALCQPRPSAWVTVTPRHTKPQRGGPNPRSKGSFERFTATNLVSALQA